MLDQTAIDKALIDLDGTPNKSKLGANAILGASLACRQGGGRGPAAPPLYNYIGGANAKILPVPMMNILNGGAHADPQRGHPGVHDHACGRSVASARPCAWCAEVFHTLKNVLKENGTPATGVGDEGGYAPNLNEG